MGLSVDDFLGLDTDEFDAALKAFSAHEEQQERERWERMRLLGLMAVQPWSKSKLTAEKLLPLPWDKAQRRSRCLQNPASDAALKGCAQNHGEQEDRRLTKAEHKARAEDMLKLLGERY